VRVKKDKEGKDEIGTLRDFPTVLRVGGVMK
jgi:hypothetical protein